MESSAVVHTSSTCGLGWRFHVVEKYLQNIWLQSWTSESISDSNSSTFISSTSSFVHGFCFRRRCGPRQSSLSWSLLTRDSRTKVLRVLSEGRPSTWVIRRTTSVQGPNPYHNFPHIRRIIWSVLSNNPISQDPRCFKSITRWPFIHYYQILSIFCKVSQSASCAQSCYGQSRLFAQNSYLESRKWCSRPTS